MKDNTFQNLDEIINLYKMTWRREQDITQQRARVSASLASMLEIYKTFDQEDGQSAAKNRELCQIIAGCKEEFQELV